MKMHDQSQCEREQDAILWERVLADDQSAFEQVVARFQNVVSSVAYSISGSFTLSQEITQETFWQAWRSRFELKDRARLAPWLCGIARNLAHQALRHESIRRTETLSINLDSKLEDPATISISEEDRNLIWNTLEQIPETYRETLVLFYREGHSISDVAEVLEISEDAVKQRLSRGRNYLRESLAGKVEDVLVRSRPGRALTSRIMAGIAALSTSLKAAGTASAAGVGNAVTKGVVSGTAATATKAALATGAGAGLLGGFIGTLGGLGGAWLGSWLPAQLAPTMTERKLLEAAGKKTFRASLVFTLFILAATTLVFLPVPIGWYIATIALASISFSIYVIRESLKTNQIVQQVRMQLKPEDDPNPSAPKKFINPEQYVGRSYTSNWKLLGIPLIDIQFATPMQSRSDNPARGRAFGWIAFGDNATGVLLAIGGIAKGLIAFGGIAFGGIAVGGLALGLTAIGGGALGLLAIGGLGIGYDAAGGGAIGWHSAAGGGAIAYHVASGGGALAHDFAVGGGVMANEVNTDMAKQIASDESLMWLLEWQAKNQTIFFVVTILLSVLPAFMMRFVYTKRPKEQENDRKAE
ncbi:MAG: sigma-70 family RNA polymerase sigma factor [Pirellulaceae bacterium]